MQQQPDKPTTTPTPEDPRQKTPMQDPPVHPEHDDEDKTRIAESPGKKPAPSGEETVRGYQANGDDSSDLEANGAKGAIRTNDPSPDHR